MFRRLKRAEPWLLLAALVASAPAAGAAAVWHDRTPQAALDTRQIDAPLTHYRALSLDLPALRDQLASAPADRSGAAPVEIELPLPDGSLRTFEVWRVAVMAPQLAARYPAIRSYHARSVDGGDPIEARLDDSPHGFAAELRLPSGIALVQPVRLGQGSDYVSFRRDALGAGANPFRCLLDAARADAKALRPAAGATPATESGANVRIYRLAMAATAEYTAFFGGTVADGMAAIVQAVNRVNGIYLTEFAVEFQLVNGNDQLVYTNPSTEPYTNNDGSAMLSQNQTNIDTIIGSANYDLGHVFSTGGGGIADVGVTCSNGAKAMGVTGSGAPTGDAFWVDYVAHEMGHQMGALHSFNDNTDGFCAGNRSSTEATEPGSGSTIMAYAGICSPGNLQPHSDAFFHAISLVPIVARLSGSAGGTICGTVLPANNSAPVVQPVATVTIPIQTPFALTGAATDAENDALTYIWEEMDLGNASPPETDDGTRPLFRSFVPSASPTRLVPKLPRILAHDPTIGIPSGGDISGETWATTTRDLNFRLTVRDNHPGGGATASTDALVHVSAAAGPFRVTAPDGSVPWIANQTERVTWNVANTNLSPVNCSAVDVYYSGDNGQTFPTVLAASAPNSGSVSVVAPNLATSTARVEVRCHGNIFFDISPAAFTVIADEIFADGFGG